MSVAKLVAGRTLGIREGTPWQCVWMTGGCSLTTRSGSGAGRADPWPALGPEDGSALLFAADELVVDGERVKFCDVPRVEGQDALLSLMALDFHGDVVVTSDMGAAVAALAARHRLDGRCASLDLVSPCSDCQALSSRAVPSIPPR